MSIAPISDAQLSANQANAQFSTGPVTDAGLAASSRNNLRHGFRSETVLLPGDNPAEYDALIAELTEEYSVEGEGLAERRFIREMANAEWCLRRVRSHIQIALTRRMETLARQYPDLGLPEIQAIATGSLATLGGPSYGTWLRYESKYERQYDRAHAGWVRHQADIRRAQRENTALEIQTQERDLLELERTETAILNELSRQPAPMASNVQNTPRPLQTSTSAPAEGPTSDGEGREDVEEAA